MRSVWVVMHFHPLSHDPSFEHDEPAQKPARHVFDLQLSSFEHSSPSAAFVFTMQATRKRAAADQRRGARFISLKG
jgi:hypothetical protein